MPASDWASRATRAAHFSLAGLMSTQPMTETVITWSGPDWQKHVLLLLKRHYGPGNFHEIPDQDRGDRGLEGFAQDGCAYQCYAAAEPLPIVDLRESQKRKITRDIKKFCDNSQILHKLLG